MPIIKLDAIDSTNDYLKQLAKEQLLENYTAVMAFEQTKGRGQMGTEWVSEAGKNLTVSVLVKDLPLDTVSIYDFNVAVALSAIGLIVANGIVKVNVKWPNDIMAENKKVGGILIENSLKSDGSFNSVVGLGNLYRVFAPRLFLCGVTIFWLLPTKEYWCPRYFLSVPAHPFLVRLRYHVKH